MRRSGRELHQWFLTTVGEYGPLTDPRRCRLERRVRIAEGSHYRLVTLDSPFRDPQLSPDPIKRPILSPHFVGDSLDLVPIGSVAVKVFQVLSHRSWWPSVYAIDEVLLIALGFVWRSADDAHRSIDPNWTRDSDVGTRRA
jgi:hypothetical protein